MPSTLVGSPDREPDRQPTITVSTGCSLLVWTASAAVTSPAAGHTVRWVKPPS